MSVSVNTGLDAIPSARDLAAGAVFLRGPDEFLVAWFLIGAFVIVTSSIGLVGTLLLLPVVILALVVGAVWKLWRGTR